MRNLILIYFVFFVSVLGFSQAQNAKYVTVATNITIFGGGGLAAGTLVTDMGTDQTYRLTEYGSPTAALSTTANVLIESNSATVTSVTSATQNQLTIVNPGTTPLLTIVTASVDSASLALPTGDDVFDYFKAETEHFKGEILSSETPSSGLNTGDYYITISDGYIIYANLGSHHYNKYDVAQWNGTAWTRRTGAENNEFLNKDYDEQSINIYPLTYYFGVGTDEPKEKLDVQGNVTVSGTYGDSYDSSGVAGQVLTSTGSGTQWIDYTSVGFDGNRTVTRAGVPNINAGGTTVNEWIENYFFPFLDPTISISLSAIYMIGTNNNVVVSGTVTLNEETLLYDGTLNRTEPSPMTVMDVFSANTTYSKSVVFNPRQTPSSAEQQIQHSYIAYTTGTNCGCTVNSSTLILDAVYPYLYGLSADDLSTGGTDAYDAMDALIEQTGDKTVSLTGTGYIYFMYPASYGVLTSIKDHNNFEQILSFTKYTVDVESTGLAVDWDTSYYIYKLNNTTTASSWDYSFIQ
jgi:hypothetical protein